MPVPPFEWHEYEVLAPVGAGAPLAAEAAPASAMVALPDLTAWPSPLAKASASC